MSETNNKIDSNVIYLEFANYSIPKFKEVKNKDYVYFGEDNTYADYLIELYLQCAIHNAIINGKVNYIYGSGLGVDEKTSTTPQKAVADNFINMMRPFIGQTIKDFEIFNSIAFEIIPNKTGSGISKIAYMPMSKIRTNKDETLYFYSNDWAQNKQSEEKTGYKEFKPFDPNDITKQSTLAVFKVKSPKNGVDKNVYGIPNYIGATAAIESDIEISNFHLNNLKSGFSAGTMINFNNGEPTEEAKETITKQIKKKATGTEKAGGLVITFNKSTENAPTITNFTPNDLDKQFIEISKRIDQQIFTAHSVVSPVLFGVSTEGALGQRNEMMTAYELFRSTYILVRQGILEDVINEFASFFGVSNKIIFKKTSPLKSLLPDSIIEKVYNDMSIDELREIMDLPKKKVVFSEESKPSLKWAKSGVKASNYEILFEREFDGMSDDECLSLFHKQTFKSELSANEKAIVDMLGKEPLTSSDVLAKLLKISVKEVNQMIDSLVERKYISSAGEPTKKGEAESEDAKTVGTEIKYRYGWRAGITPDKNSREFCADLLEKDELFTRAQIEGMDNEQGLEVWDSRGGWWNKGGANVPYCRHIFKQVVVKLK